MSDLICGPCHSCGVTNYTLSFGGPTICPACDCGVGIGERRLQMELIRAQLTIDELRVVIDSLRRGEFICTRCGIRKDSEQPSEPAF